MPPHAFGNGPMELRCADSLSLRGHIIPRYHYNLRITGLILTRCLSCRRLVGIASLRLLDYISSDKGCVPSLRILVLIFDLLPLGFRSLLGYMK